MDVLVVLVEDEDQVRTLHTRFLQRVTGCQVLAFANLEELRLASIQNERIVLVTDGNIDGNTVTCLDVIEHAVQTFGVERLGGTCLVVSGGEEARWAHAMEVGRERGLEMFYRPKPVGAEFKVWWNLVRGRFGL